MFGLLVVNLKNKLIMKGRFQMGMLNTINKHNVCRERSGLKTNHVYNIDCLEGLRMMPDNSVDLVLTDPPYALDNSDGIGTGVAKDYKYLKEIDYMCNGFDLRILDECMRVLRGNAFFFCSKDQIPMYIKYFAGTDMNIQVLTWSKTDAPPLCCGKYLSDTEYIIYAYRSDCADKYPLITDHFITPRVKSNRNDPLYHPCKKPTEILSTLIKSTSKEGDVVLDMFAGSASTMVSCVETGRRFIGFELMEKYYNAGNERIAIALEEHPEYKLESTPLISKSELAFKDTASMFDAIEDDGIDLAFLDICDKGNDIPYDFFEKVVSKQKKPNLYIMTDVLQFTDVLMYFVKQNYKYDIITNHYNGGTKYMLFLRKGGVKLYGTYHTKRKFFVDDRDMSLPCQDNIPQELMERIITNSSLPGETVFCSGGYGTSISCCIDMDRRYIVYESDNDKFLHCIDAIYHNKHPTVVPYSGQIG